MCIRRRFVCGRRRIRNVGRGGRVGDFMSRSGRAFRRRQRRRKDSDHVAARVAKSFQVVC